MRFEIIGNRRDTSEGERKRKELLREEKEDY